MNFQADVLTLNPVSFPRADFGEKNLQHIPSIINLFTKQAHIIIKIFFVTKQDIQLNQGIHLLVQLKGVIEN